MSDFGRADCWLKHYLPDSNAAAVQEFEKAYPCRVTGIPAGVIDYATIAATTEQAVAKFGRIDS